MADPYLKAYFQHLFGFFMAFVALQNFVCCLGRFHLQVDLYLLKSGRFIHTTRMPCLSKIGLAFIFPGEAWSVNCKWYINLFLNVSKMICKKI